jgi:hypothetical protein
LDKKKPQKKSVDPTRKSNTFVYPTAWTNKIFLSPSPSLSLSRRVVFGGDGRREAETRSARRRSPHKLCTCCISWNARIFCIHAETLKTETLKEKPWQWGQSEPAPWTMDGW